MSETLSLHQARKYINKYGSPLFVTHKDVILNNIEKYRKGFKNYSGGFSLAYSVKTNPMISLLQIFYKEGVLAEICTESDMTAAFAAGYKGEKMIFDGLVKTDDELKTAIKHKINVTNIESLGEAERLVTLSNKFKTELKVGIRLSFPSSKVGFKSLLGVSYDRFGVSRSTGEFEKIIKTILKSKYLKLVGLHCHTGSNQKSPQRFFVGIDEMINSSIFLRDKYGIKIELLNIGGGMGIEEISAYKISDLGINVLKRFLGKSLEYKQHSFDLENTCKKLTKYLEKKLKANNLPPPHLMAEPGRSLVGNSTHLITTIIETKKSEHRNWIIIDAGTNLMPMLTVYSEYHNIAVLTKSNNKKLSSIAGPLLYSADIIASNRILPQGQRGDLVIVKDVGAYFNCQANQFLHPRTATILVEGNSSRIIQQRESVDDMLVRDM